MDWRGIPGWDHVDRLATYLVTLSGLTLSNEAANKIVELYERLDDFDKERTRYTQRHRARQLQGRFKSTKGASRFISGVEATKRYIGFTSSYIIIYYKIKYENLCLSWKSYKNCTLQFCHMVSYGRFNKF